LLKLLQEISRRHAINTKETDDMIFYTVNLKLILFQPLPDIRHGFKGLTKNHGFQVY